MKFTKILLNQAHTPFYFSKLFGETLMEDYNVKIEDIKFYNSFRDKMHNNINIESRYDERIIKTFEKLGSKKSSPSNIISLTIVEIPTDLILYLNIKEQFGYETIFINLSRRYKTILLDALKEELISVETINKIEENNKYEEYLTENNILYL